MKIRRALGAALSWTFAAAAATAASSQTFVSAQHGSDSNPCSVASPCRSLATALGATETGGEVVVLDSGPYSAATISKSVSIEAPAGIYAGISVASGDGITIAAGAADSVVLRGLTITSAGTNGFGIVVDSAGTVQIDRCAVSGFSRTGIRAFSSTGFNLILDDSVVRACGFGVVVVGQTSQPVLGAIDRSRVENCNVGVEVLDDGKATVRDSTVSGGIGGIDAYTFHASTAAEVTVENCLVTNNSGDGVSVGGADGTSGGLARVSHSTITDNGVGLDQTAAGRLLSGRNNLIAGNGDDENGTIGTFSVRNVAPVGPEGR